MSLRIYLPLPTTSAATGGGPLLILTQTRAPTRLHRRLLADVPFHQDHGVEGRRFGLLEAIPRKDLVAQYVATLTRARELARLLDSKNVVDVGTLTMRRTTTGAPEGHELMISIARENGECTSPRRDMLAPQEHHAALQNVVQQPNAGMSRLT